MADKAAATFWKKRFDELNSRVSELEFENHNLKAGSNAEVKQDPEEIAQLEDFMNVQKRMVVEANMKTQKLEEELIAEKQYVSHLKSKVSAMEGTEKAMKTSSSGTKSTLAQEKKKVLALEDQVHELKMQLRDVKTDNHRLKFDVKQLREQVPGPTLTIPCSLPKAPASLKQSIALPSFKEKRKWQHVDSNAASDPRPNSKKSKPNESDRDDSEPDLDDMPLAKRKMLAIKKEHHEDDMPLAQRKTLATKNEAHKTKTPLPQRNITVPVSQMAQVKLEPGTAPKTAPETITIEDSSEDETPLWKKRQLRSAGGQVQKYHGMDDMEDDFPFA